MDGINKFLPLFLLSTSFCLGQSSTDLESAMRAFRDGRYPDAIPVLEQAILSDQDPRNQMIARYYLAEIYWRSAKRDEAIAAFDELASALESQRTASKSDDRSLSELYKASEEAGLRTARFLLSIGSVDAALVRAEKIVRQSPSPRTKILGNLLLGAIYADGKSQHEHAIASFDAVLENAEASDAEKAIAMYGKCTSLFAKKEFDSASTEIQSCLTKDSFATIHANLRLLYGFILLEQQDYESCNAVLEQIKKTEDGLELNDQRILLAARYAQAVGDVEGSVAAWLQITSNFADRPSAIEARIALARHAIQKNEIDRAAEWLDAINQIQCNSEQLAMVLTYKGVLAVTRLQFDEAEATLLEALKHVQELKLQTTARFYLAEVQYRTNRWQEADEHWQWLSNAATNGTLSKEMRSLVLIRRAEHSAHQMRWDDVDGLLASLGDMGIEPRQQPEVDYLLGRSAFAKADLEKARQYFGQVVESSYGRQTEMAARAQWMIGESYLIQNNLDAALQAYATVLSLYDFDEWKAAAITQSGKCYEIRGQLTEAAKLYGQVASQYADTSYAEIASNRISELKLAKSNSRKSLK